MHQLQIITSPAIDQQLIHLPAGPGLHVNFTLPESPELRTANAQKHSSQEAAAIRPFTTRHCRKAGGCVR
jgi:hypothetical protein